jgi:NRPS condensation-like uncharacterized protein
MDFVYKRKLSDSERLWLGANLAFSPFANQIVIEGKGTIDFERLVHAVYEASAVNPGSRLVLKGFLYWSYWVDSKITPRVRKVENADWDGTSNDGAYFLKMDLPHSGPTCEVVYIEGETTRIAFRTNHAVMDARGTLIWIEDIFRVLRGEKPVGSSSTLTDYELIKSVSDKKKKFDPIKVIPPTGKAGEKAKGTSWKRITVSGHYTNILGRIAVALAQSAWRYQDGRFRIAVPVDLRPRIAGLRSTGNLSNTIYCEITKDSTPESVMKDIREQIDNKNDCINIDRGNYLGLIPLWLMSVFFRIGSRLILKYGFFTIPVCVSNVGRMDAEKFSCEGFTADSVFALPLSGDGQPAFIAVFGMSGKIEILAGIPNMICNNGRLDRLMEDIKKAFLL